MQNVVFTPEKVSIEKALSVGWQCTKREFVPLLVVMIVSWLIPLFLGFFFCLLGFAIPKDQPILAISFTLITSLVSALVAAVMDLGMINVLIKVLDGGTAKVSDLFSANHLFLKYVMGQFCFNFLMLWGFIFLIIPGLIVSLFMQFYTYFIVDKNLGPIEALRASWIVCRGGRINVVLLMLIFSAMRGLGAMLFIIGLVPVHMIVVLATTELYRQLLNNTSPEELAGIQGMLYSLPPQDDFNRGHVFTAPPAVAAEAGEEPVHSIDSIADAPDPKTLD